MIKQQVNFDMFNSWFLNSENYRDKYSYEGRKALFEYIETISEDCGEDWHFDPIALCCDYTEYDSFEDLQKDYPDIKDFEDLNEKTEVITIDNAMKTENFIILNF